MSSNIKVQRICQHCGKEFTARTTVTKYCSHRCASAANKTRIRAEKVQTSNKETNRVIIQPIEELKAKEFLSIREVATLLGCSIRTAYRLVNNGTLKAVNLAERLTRVKRSELNKLLEQPKPVQPQSTQYDITDCYTLTEVQDKYSISDRALHELIKRNNIPKIKKGWYAYVPKTMIDQIFK